LIKSVKSGLFRGGKKGGFTGKGRKEGFTVLTILEKSPKTVDHSSVF